MAQVTIGRGYDMDYYLDQVRQGADYYLDAGEPPGVWIGRAAADDLSLYGEADPDEVRNLYHKSIAPDGQVLGKANHSPTYEGKRQWKEIEEAIQKRIDDLGPLATPAKIRQIKHSERAKSRTSTPYLDMTFSSEKSVSLAWAAARVNALLAIERDERENEQHGERERAGGGDPAEQGEAARRPGGAEAARWERLGEQIEQATLAGGAAMIDYAENNSGATVRTGHHSSTTGEWRDATGLIGVAFLQHTSRSHDPQLHVQVPVLNKGKRADGADDKWRALDGRQLYALRLGAAAHAGMAEAQALARLGLPLVKRADGYGWEIGGVSQATMDRFSKRSKAIAKKREEKLKAYEEVYGTPSRSTLYRLRKTATVETRAPKTAHQSGPSKKKRGPSSAEAAAAEERLLEWADEADAQEAQALTDVWDDIYRFRDEHPEAMASEPPSEDERDRICRAATAEVQRQNASWSRAQLLFELYRQMPSLPADMDWRQYLEELADDIIDGRIEDANVLQIGHVPDIVNTSRLGLRKDGTSVYRRPNEARYCTAEHLDTEQWILEECARPVPQLVSDEAAAAAVAGTDLDPSQQRAARGLLTSTTLVTSLIAPAGSGKTHVLGPVSRAWMAETGARVIGLTLSQNAAGVMAREGVAEAYNIARFFKRKIPVHQGDVLIIDEASQVGTNDLTRIMRLAHKEGARVIMVGDPEQLGPVEAGGMMKLVAKKSASYELEEVHRFTEAWEADASIRLRDGDTSVWIEYGSRGFVHEGPRNRMLDEAADTYVLDTYGGHSALLVAASNEEAAELAAIVRQRRIEHGEIPGQADITLADGNEAGRGDLIRARLNSRIKADGKVLENRDTIRIEGWTGAGASRRAVAVLRNPETGEWSQPFHIPASYLEEHAELDYAGTVHVSQGRTVDRQTVVIKDGTDRRTMYVGMTRGRMENRAYFITGPDDPADWTREQRKAWAAEAMQDAIRLHQAGDLQGAIARIQMPEPEGMRPRAPWEAVAAACMEREPEAETATEVMREALDLPNNLRHLHNLRQAFWWADVVPEIDAMIRDRIPEREYRRYLADPERPALLQALREHEIGGRAIEDVLDSITRDDFAGANSIAAVLHGRAGKLEAPQRGQTTTWAERTPSRARAELREIDEAADRRQTELGEQLAEAAPHWALEAWGVPPTEAGARRDDWVRNAGQVQAYREMAGITDPNVAIGPPPARQADLTEAFAASVRALQLADDAALMKAMGRGDLEARVREYERAEATAPADVRPDLETNQAAIKFAEKQAQQAREAGRPELAQSAEALQTDLAGERARLRVADSARAEWDEATADQAALAEQARDELRRRRIPMPEPVQEPGTGEPVHVDPDEHARRRAEQTAQVEADRQARRAAGFQAMSEIDPELAREVYPDLVQAEAEHEPTAQERIERDLEAIRSARQTVERKIDQLELQDEEDRRRRIQREPQAEVEAEVEAEAERDYRRPTLQRPPDHTIDRGPEPHL